MGTFSNELQDFITSNGRKTLQDLINTFAEKSFAVLFLLLMAVPALPLPTGGVTHVFEIITFLVAIELIVGRKTVWLPQRWQKLTIPIGKSSSSFKKLIATLDWVEKHSKSRFKQDLERSAPTKLVGIAVLIFTIFAFLAPPFTGLDTLPALGVVLLSLALIFDNALLISVGILVGVIGIVLVFFLGRLVFQIL